ncbi:hypothetical protein [Caballeronia sp. BR00000012568055]|uniref:hypothetical protein n=1 Tax=Caballeronia sp. BR00000012568055 TaxID=2918761 RepID=UPI0023F95608|nr:hypothetical protein [Caballeronia sp. BR00000012568055]
MNPDDQRSALDKADHNIELARRRIARQRAVVKQLEALRGDVSTALTLLRTLEDTLTAMESHRVLIMARILNLNQG